MSLSMQLPDGQRFNMHDIVSVEAGRSLPPTCTWVDITDDRKNRVTIFGPPSFTEGVVEAFTGPKRPTYWVGLGENPEGHPEWQFSDGPVGQRSYSNDYLSLEAGMRELAPAFFIMETE